jgi:hypothetical protein
MSAPVNRAQRRRARSGQQNSGRVEDYRVGAGQVALTIDAAGLSPMTVSIEEGALAGVASRFDGSMTGKTYAEALRSFVSALRRTKSGHEDAAYVGLFGWWLAFRHPAAAAAMVRTTSDMMARGEPVHLSLHIGVTGGLTFALSDKFIDLDRVAEHAKALKLGATVFDLTGGQVRETRQ